MMVLVSLCVAIYICISWLYMYIIYIGQLYSSLRHLNDVFIRPKCVASLYLYVMIPASMSGAQLRSSLRHLNTIVLLRVSEANEVHITLPKIEYLQY